MERCRWTLAKNREKAEPRMFGARTLPETIDETRTSTYVVEPFARAATSHLAGID